MTSKHIPTLITLTVEERDTARLLATKSGKTVSEWFGDLIRSQLPAKTKLPPRNRTGRPAATKG